MNMQQNDHGTSRPSPSFELIVQGNENPAEETGAPHLILRRRPLDVEEAGKAGPEPQDTPGTGELEVNSPAGADTVSSDDVAAYIASLSNHVPEDVSRVVDAIIAEESKLPTGLPTLDEAMSAIYTRVDDEAPIPDEPEPEKTPHYVKRVEYEDR